MGMPTEEELNEALAEAARMREQDEDPHHIAKVLLNLNYRVEQLESVMAAAEKYFNSGMSVQEENELRIAIETARKSIDRTGAIEEEKFGLG